MVMVLVQPITKPPVLSPAMPNGTLLLDAISIMSGVPAGPVPSRLTRSPFILKRCALTLRLGFDPLCHVTINPPSLRRSICRFCTLVVLSMVISPPILLPDASNFCPIIEVPSSLQIT